MNKAQLKKLLILNLPYVLIGLYEVEKTYETEDSLLYDLAHYDDSIELTTWLDDLFGDG